MSSIANSSIQGVITRSMSVRVRQPIANFTRKSIQPARNTAPCNTIENSYTCQKELESRPIERNIQQSYLTNNNGLNSSFTHTISSDEQNLPTQLFINKNPYLNNTSNENDQTDANITELEISADPVSQIRVQTQTQSNKQNLEFSASIFHKLTSIDSNPLSPDSTVQSKQTRKKIYPKDRPYKEILDGVVFVLSGYANPKRRRIKDLAIAMGAKYQIKWNDQCTHLICSFKNTHKYNHAKAKNARIVKEHWLVECNQSRKLLDWRDYKLGQYNYQDSEEEVDEDLGFLLHQAYGIPRMESLQTV